MEPQRNIAIDAIKSYFERYPDEAPTNLGRAIVELLPQSSSNMSAIQMATRFFASLLAKWRKQDETAAVTVHSENEDFASWTQDWVDQVRSFLAVELKPEAIPDILSLSNMEMNAFEICKKGCPIGRFSFEEV